MYCNRTIFFNSELFLFDSMISQAVPNFKTQFSPKDEVCNNDKIALNQRNVDPYISFV